ncbi:MAG: hypothetical protein K0S32_3948 [Bacteroidetes bacterium]|jgi:hypothetical protein|nr:hypothetical protein [Bacteroidota bacterium]
MKKIIIGFLLVVFFVSCTEEPKNETVTALATPLPPYTLQIKAIESKKTDSTGVVLLETTLWNNTKDTLRYLTMSCSWEDIYCFSNPNVFIPPTECTKNAPTIISVLPETNAKTIFNAYLAGTSQNSQEKVKLGIKLIKVPAEPDSSGKRESIHNLENVKNILWSNEIEL